MAHAHHHQIPVDVEGEQGVRRGAKFIIGGLTSGHGVFHWFTNSFITMLPRVAATFGLSDFQVGAITATREVVSGIVSLPGGVVTDMLRRHWGLVLASCMALFGLGWLVMGFAPIYPLLLVGMALVAIAASSWHLPAMAALSHHFSHRRGSALSFHGVGGNIGDVAAPVVTGALLGFFAWQGIIKVYAIIPLFLAFLVFWAFKDIGRTGQGNHSQPELRAQLAQTSVLMKNPRLWSITLVAGIRGMAFISFITFLPLYLSRELGLSPLEWGLHLGLLQAIGILSTPVMGYLSDRLGRKTLLIPGMLLLCGLTVLLVPYGEGIVLIIILGLLGTFLFSDQPILTAAALDIVGSGVAATALGVMSFSRFALSAASPLIGGKLSDSFGIEATFFYIAGLFALAIAVLLFIPIPKVETIDHQEHAHHGHGTAGPEHDDHDDHRSH